MKFKNVLMSRNNPRTVHFVSQGKEGSWVRHFLEVINIYCYKEERDYTIKCDLAVRPWEASPLCLHKAIPFPGPLLLY